MTGTKMGNYKSAVANPKKWLPENNDELGGIVALDHGQTITNSFDFTYN